MVNFLPGGNGGSLSKNFLASSKDPGTTTTGSLSPVVGLILLDTTDSGIPPPLSEPTLLLAERRAGGGNSTDSGVAGESRVATDRTAWDGSTLSKLEVRS